MPGPSVTIVESGGIAVVEVESGAPAFTAVESGGIAVTLAAFGIPMVIEGSTPAPSDSTPNAFSFTDQTGAARSTVVESNAITVAGIDTASTVTITGGEYQIGAGSWVSSSGSVTVGQSVKVRLTTSASFSTIANATLTIGGVSDTFSVTTLAQDTTPNAFSFTDANNVALSTVTESNAITVAGINDASTITITGGEYQKNGGSWVSSSGTVVNGDSVKVRGTSSGSSATAVNVVLTIGGVSDTFTVTTAGGLTAPDVTVTSGAGDPPEVTIGLKSDHFAGYFLRIQRNEDGAVDGNGDYTDQTLEAASNGVLYFISAEDLADGITNAELATVGYVDPTGTYFQQYRIENEIDQVSPWVEIDGAILVAVTTFHNTNGVNKSQYVDVDTVNRIVALNRDDIGASCAARATQQPSSDKTVFEVTLTSLQAVHYSAIMIDDGTSVYGAASYDVPGLGGKPGVTIRFHESWGEIFVGGVDTPVGAGVEGDVISVEIDKTTGEIEFFRTRSAVTTQLGGTFTPPITSWYPAIGHIRTAAFEANFGQEPFVRTPNTGFVMYG